MSVDTRSLPITLTVLRQDEVLVSSLTDSHTHALLGQHRVSDAQLDALHVEFRALAHAPPPAAADRHRVEAALLSFGTRLLESLLPAPIRTFLLESHERALTLQLDPGLAWVPWELGRDGRRFLGEKFRLCRRVVTNEECAPAIGRPSSGHAPRVCLAGAPDTGARAASQVRECVHRAARLAGFVVVDLGAADPSTADAAIDADVVHFFGPDAVAAARLARRASARLMILHETEQAPAAGPLLQHDGEMALQASRLGLTTLALGGPTHVAAMGTLLEALYSGLGKGAGIAEAACAARGEVLRTGGAAPLAALGARLYGDGDVVLQPQGLRAPSEDNRRQLTIMSFDLVGSTRLLEELGAERYSDLLAQYHRLSANLLARRGGTPDDPQGDDGLMCYFGLPFAREDAAEQAVRAGLELIEAVQPLRVQLRVGICTGLVVVRDGTPVGSPVHLAARLQSLALPGTVVAGDSTRKIVKDSFRFDPLPPGTTLKGFDRHEPLFRVSWPDHGTARLASQHLSPFVGRSREWQSLHAHWSRARSGALCAVRLVGEAGIGKSRLLREFRRSLLAEGYDVFECRCAAEFSNSAFRPVIEALRQELRLDGIGSAEAARERLQPMAARTTHPEQSLALLADLLSVPQPAASAVQALPPERRRQLTLDLLVELGRARVSGTAGCMIVEDVHWIDPSTADLLDRLASDDPQLPLLLLVTSRPDAEVPWKPRTRFDDEELRGLPAEEARALVTAVGGEADLPAEVVHMLAARADGVPLFIEESTRVALELGAGQTDAHGALMQLVPTTILDLLTVRLDRLAGAKQVAQICGTIGREFPLALLRAAVEHADSPFRPPDLPAQVATLMGSGMLVRRGEAEDAKYRFRHALMRDAAYRSLLERDRTRLHRVVARVLREQFAELAGAQPEMLAFHLTEAGDVAEAVPCWEAAARLAASRSANVEAINHLHAALATLARWPEGTERDRTEMRLLLLLATRLIATEGYGADRVERVYGRAMALARKLDDAPARMRVLLGLEAYHSARAEFDKAMAIAEDARTSAAGAASEIHRIQIKWAVANLIMHQGDMQAAVVQMDECLADYDRLTHRPAAVQDPGVMCLCYSAWALWQLGHPDRAMQRIRDVVARAEQMKHQFSLGQVYGFQAAIQMFRGELGAARASAEHAIGICQEGGFPMWLALAELICGRVRVEQGEADAGLEQMREAHARWQATGTVLTMPFYLALRADGLAQLGRCQEGLPLLRQALEIIERCGERYYEAEVHRVHARLLLGAGDAGGEAARAAETWLRSALESARKRGLRSLALRTAIDLARLWRSVGRPAEARQLLEGALGAIEEGGGTRDPSLARELLGQLAPSTTPTG